MDSCSWFHCWKTQKAGSTWGTADSTATVLLAVLSCSHLQRRPHYSNSYSVFQAELGTQHPTHAVAAMLLVMFKITSIWLCELQSQQWIQYSTSCLLRNKPGIHTHYMSMSMLYTKSHYSWLDTCIKLNLITIPYYPTITVPVGPHA